MVPNNSLVIGTHVLKLKDPAIGLANDEPILAIVPKVTSNDHEAGSSQAVATKPRDPKYTQPKWCPPGITKTQRRKLQRARNREKVEEEAERVRDAKFNAEKPMVSAQVWVPKPTPVTTPLMIAPSPAISDETEPVSVPTVTYSSWADEVEVADLEVGDKPVRGESDKESANGNSAENSTSEELAGDDSETLDRKSVV